MLPVTIKPLSILLMVVSKIPSLKQENFSLSVPRERVKQCSEHDLEVSDLLSGRHRIGLVAHRDVWQCTAPLKSLPGA